jgi:hypothetical protein
VREVFTLIAPRLHFDHCFRDSRKTIGDEMRSRFSAEFTNRADDDPVGSKQLEPRLPLRRQSLLRHLRPLPRIVTQRCTSQTMGRMTGMVVLFAGATYPDLGASHRARQVDQNAFIESFNGRMRDELPNETLFTSLASVRAALSA